MKVLSKFFRCSCVLLLALIVAVSAAIGVSADIVYPEIVCFRANASGAIQTRFSLNTGYNITYPDGKYYGFFVDQQLLADYTYVFTVNITGNMTTSLSDNIGYTSDIYYISNLTNRITSIPNNGGNLIDYANVTVNQYPVDNGQQGIEYIITFNSNDLNELGKWLYLVSESNIRSGETDYIYYTGWTVAAKYDPNKTVLDNINEKIDTIINNQNNMNNMVSDQLQQIIVNQNSQNQYWDILINYGNEYNQIDQTIINNLGSAEDQLSSAEDALENKSKSLKDSVASQWSTIQSTSKTFITNLAPAAAAVGTVTTQFMNAAPEEIKGLFVTIPLLIFIGWLIGRIRGD